jgi:hypothetical protein
MRIEKRAPANRRTEPRVPAVAAVHFRQSRGPGSSFVGHLLDIAATGFRARHDRMTLISGDLVDYEFEGHNGLARAMWTRIVDGQVETGFRICQETCQEKAMP